MHAPSRDTLRRAWLCVGWLMVLYVTWQSLAPQPFTQGMGSDKFQHTGTYALLAWWFGCAADRAGVGRRLSVALALVAMGTAIEGLQALLPPREPSLLDALANALGVVLGGLLAAVPRINGLDFARRRMRDRGGR